MIRVILADDQALVRTGFRMILEGTDDIVVVGEAADGEEAVDLVRAVGPDMVLMDVRMPRLDGIAATELITSDSGHGGARARVLVLTTFDLDEYVYAALRAGASGFILKDALVEEVCYAIRTVARGDAVVAPSTTRRLIERFVASLGTELLPPERLTALTPREREVLTLVGEGLANSEIAQRLYLSEGTVKVHVSKVFAKLQLRDRVQAVILAYDTGLVRPGIKP